MGVKHTVDGIKFLPELASGIISTLPLLIIPTHENIVPKSIPIIGPLSFFSVMCLRLWFGL